MKNFIHTVRDVAYTFGVLLGLLSLFVLGFAGFPFVTDAVLFSFSFSSPLFVGFLFSFIATICFLFYAFVKMIE